ncbi:hypothetical protein BMS3Abin14_00942 [bacterium BMS3Abin14]|nr:hypothetical protein BMS3Abin14_00942 [bacterium BMS3Abin14]
MDDIEGCIREQRVEPPQESPESGSLSDESALFPQRQENTPKQKKDQQQIQGMQEHVDHTAGGRRKPQEIVFKNKGQIGDHPFAAGIGVIQGNVVDLIPGERPF